jgi:DNA-binding MltR family transcriptional regulator
MRIVGGWLANEAFECLVSSPEIMTMRSPESKRRTLRALGKQRPSDDEWLIVGKEIAAASARSAAILLAANVEGTLSTIIEMHLVVRSEEALEPLYARDGALSSFFSKIHLGYAMGLYDEKIRDDLEVIRRVRNAFAHVRKPIDFSTIEIVDECRKITTVKDPTHPISQLYDWKKLDHKNERDLYIMAGMSISVYFLLSAKKTSKAAVRKVRRQFNTLQRELAALKRELAALDAITRERSVTPQQGNASQ